MSYAGQPGQRPSYRNSSPFASTAAERRSDTRQKSKRADHELRQFKDLFKQKVEAPKEGLIWSRVENLPLASRMVFKAALFSVAFLNIEQALGPVMQEVFGHLLSHLESEGKQAPAALSQDSDGGTGVAVKMPEVGPVGVPAASSIPKASVEWSVGSTPQDVKRLSSGDVTKARMVGGRRVPQGRPSRVSRHPLATRPTVSTRQDLIQRVVGAANDALGVAGKAAWFLPPYGFPGAEAAPVLSSPSLTPEQVDEALRAQLNRGRRSLDPALSPQVYQSGIVGGVSGLTTDYGHLGDNDMVFVAGNTPVRNGSALCVSEFGSDGAQGNVKMSVSGNQSYTHQQYCTHGEQTIAVYKDESGQYKFANNTGVSSDPEIRDVDFGEGFDIKELVSMGPDHDMVAIVSNQTRAKFVSLDSDGAIVGESAEFDVTSGAQFVPVNGSSACELGVVCIESRSSTDRDARAMVYNTTRHAVEDNRLIVQGAEKIEVSEDRVVAVHPQGIVEDDALSADHNRSTVTARVNGTELIEVQDITSPQGVVVKVSASSGLVAQQELVGGSRGNFSFDLHLDWPKIGRQATIQFRDGVASGVLEVGGDYAGFTTVANDGNMTLTHLGPDGSVRSTHTGDDVNFAELIATRPVDDGQWVLSFDGNVNITGGFADVPGMEIAPPQLEECPDPQGETLPPTSGQVPPPPPPPPAPTKLPTSDAGVDPDPDPDQIPDSGSSSGSGNGNTGTIVGVVVVVAVIGGFVIGLDRAGKINILPCKKRENAQLPGGGDVVNNPGYVHRHVEDRGSRDSQRIQVVRGTADAGSRACQAVVTALNHFKNSPRGRAYDKRAELESMRTELRRSHKAAQEFNSVQDIPVMKEIEYDHQDDEPDEKQTRIEEDIRTSFELRAQILSDVIAHDVETNGGKNKTVLDAELKVYQGDYLHVEADGAAGPAESLYEQAVTHNPQYVNPFSAPVALPGSEYSDPTALDKAVGAPEVTYEEAVSRNPLYSSPPGMAAVQTPPVYESIDYVVPSELRNLVEEDKDVEVQLTLNAEYIPNPAGLAHDAGDPLAEVYAAIQDAAAEGVGGADVYAPTYAVFRDDKEDADDRGAAAADDVLQLDSVSMAALVKHPQGREFIMSQKWKQLMMDRYNQAHPGAEKLPYQFNWAKTWDNLLRRFLGDNPQPVARNSVLDITLLITSDESGFRTYGTARPVGDAHA